MNITEKLDALVKSSQAERDLSDQVMIARRSETNARNNTNNAIRELIEALKTVSESLTPDSRREFREKMIQAFKPE